MKNRRYGSDKCSRRIARTDSSCHAMPHISKKPQKTKQPNANYFPCVLYFIFHLPCVVVHGGVFFAEPTRKGSKTDVEHQESFGILPRGD